jgi:hypothetical protein
LIFLRARIFRALESFRTKRDGVNSVIFPGKTKRG